MTLSTLGAVAIGVVYSLAIVAGSATPKFLLGAGTMLAMTLTCTTPVVIPLRRAGATLGNATALVIVGWLLLYVLAARLSVRARRTLASRPHAFLLDDR